MAGTESIDVDEQCRHRDIDLNREMFLVVNKTGWQTVFFRQVFPAEIREALSK